MSTENKGKTPQEWAEYLPEPIRTQFLENVDKDFDHYQEYTTELFEAIGYSFHWGLTDVKGQGVKYWLDIHTRAANGEFSQPIPTTPTDVKEESNEQEVCSMCGKTLREQMKGCNQIACYRQFLPLKSPQPTPTKAGNVTAVEWLLERTEDVDLTPETWELIKTKAKAMEKEQIENAFVAGDERGTNDIPFNCEQYYNQTYGGEK